MTVHLQTPRYPSPGLSSMHAMHPSYEYNPCHKVYYQERNILRHRLHSKIVAHSRAPLPPKSPRLRGVLRRAYVLPVHPSVSALYHVQNQTPVSVSDDEASVESQRAPRVSFDPRVAVYLIPHRDTYDDKSAIWSNRVEIKRRASRNTIEYTYERFNWRLAVEEHDFLMLPDGKFIHPAHIHKDQHYYLRLKYRQRMEAHKSKQHVLLQAVHDLDCQA